MTVYQNISNSTIINGKKIDLEKLAELEHLQWWDYAMTLLNKLKNFRDMDMTLEEAVSDLETSFNPKFIPYEELSENVKEYDRVYARKVLDVIENEQ